MILQPLVFEEDIHPAIWGGERWLVSAHASRPSVVKGGAWAGWRLDDLAKVCGGDLLGSRAPGRFPLLIKEIDARSRLSVQVHPNETTKGAFGGEAKTEMWHVLDAGDQGAVYAGLRPGVPSAELDEAVRDGRVGDLVLRHAVRPGDGVFIPGGLVHAIGDGVRVFEVQQSSATTYRLYDWGRVGPDGKARTLHVKEGLATVDPGTVPVIVRGELACPFFRLTPVACTAPRRLEANPDSFRVIFVTRGSLRVATAAQDLALKAGEATLVPAVCPADLRPETADAKLLVVSL